MDNQTQAQVQKQKADSLKMEICLLLNWTDQQYCEYQYENGIAYLMWYLPCDDYARHQLERSRLYWNWFKYQWMLHDESLLSYKVSVRECSVKTLLPLYQNLHCPRALAVEIKPNSVVLADIKTNASV